MQRKAQMEFRRGTHIYTSDGKDVGNVDRVVLNPKTKEVTHIVVREGLIITEDKVIPLDLIDSATDERLTLRGIASDLDTLLPFKETHYLPLDDTESTIASYPLTWAAPYYWYGPVAGEVPNANYEADHNHAYYPVTEQNTPEESVALKEGARVITANGQDIGSVTRVFTNPQNNQVTHFVITEGTLIKEHKLVPMNWIRAIQENEIRLNVGASILNKVPEYKEPYPAPQN